MLRHPLSLLLLLLASRLLAAEPASLLKADDLRRLSETASAQHIPILLMISQNHCGFCEQMRDKVLNPMQLSGEYSDRVLMRELTIDPGEMVINFQGRRETGEAFSDRYDIKVTPTLLFLDENGSEVAHRILGLDIIDYIFYYIDEGIESAKQSMVR